MLSVADALEAVLGESHALPAMPAPLGSALGLALAEAITSEVDSPPFDKSAMDGFAVRAADLARPGAKLRQVGVLTAGETFPGKVGPGEAVRIMTGAPLPRGTDTVVRIEDTSEDGPGVVIIEVGASQAGRHVIPRGAMLSQGEVVLPAGRLLRPQELALLAELGRAEVRVHRRPRAAVLATGDELVAPGMPLAPGQICNSNETLLVAQLRNWGCEAEGLGIARDREEDLRERIEAGLAYDLLLLTGGVSMGIHDLVPKVLAELGARQRFHKVALKPGKPVWFGTCERPPGETGGPEDVRRTLIFALPGNPVSSMVCSELFVRPAVRRLSGRRSPAVVTVPARLTREHRFAEDRPTYFPAWLEWHLEGAVVTPTEWKGSADLRSTVEANSLIGFPAGDRVYPAGAVVEVVPFAEPSGQDANESTGER